MTAGAVGFAPAGPLRGAVRVPSDKSITQRALVIAALCHDPVTVYDPLWAGDTEATAGMLGALGVELARGSSQVVVRGRGLRGLRAPEGALDARNAGTAMRLLAGVLAGQEGRFVLDGDESLRARPMERIVTPLRLMGARIDARGGRFAPLAITGGELTGIKYELPVASAQVKSCLLLAGLLARGETTVIETLPSRDHTERMLTAAGAPLKRGTGWCSVRAAAALTLADVHVPGDVSSAAFIAAAATLVPGSDVEIRGVGLNPTRMGFYDVLRRMGGDLTWHTSEERGGEPVGSLHVRAAALHGVDVDAHEVPLLVDELPLVALLGAFADGVTSVAGAGELRVKESDRLAAVGHTISGLGGRADVGADGFSVSGGGLRGGIVESGGDHRIALLGAVAGLACPEGADVVGFEAAEVSFPAFRDLLQEVIG